MARVGFGHSEIANQGIIKAAKEISAETGGSWNEAVRQACATMDGAGDNPEGTVESVQTCTDIGKKLVGGLTTNDVLGRRTDGFAKTTKRRRLKAEKGADAAAKWLKKNDKKSSSAT